MGGAGVSAELVVLLGALFLLACVLASKISSKLGIPALLLFVGIGMLAGSEGPGGIQFDDYRLAKNFGLLLLSMILFAGGLDTQWSEVKPIAWRGIALSTIGVAVTAGLTGVFAHFVLGVPLLHGLLLGSIVASTDSAAIFSVLRVRGFHLKHRIAPLLEFESGTNDPMAVFLTLGLIELIKQPSLSPWMLLPRLMLQMSIGLAVGYLAARGAVWLINRIRLEYDGLYMVITLATAALTYGGAHLLGGSEFLAVYVAGLTMGSRNFVHKVSLTQFHDGVAWLMQICVFLLLGLLVFPSELVPAIASGTIVALFIMLVARPISVFAALAPGRMSKRAKAFIAWAGLRGGFPIILGAMPILEGLGDGARIFNVVFFVVLLSVLVQGTTLRLFGRRTHVLLERAAEPLIPAQNSELLEITLSEDSRAAGRQVVELGLPRTALIVLLRRGSQDYIPRGGSVLQPGDRLLIATRREDHDELKRLFEAVA